MVSAGPTPGVASSKPHCKPALGGESRRTPRITGLGSKLVSMGNRDRVDDVFREFNDTVNMSPGELDAWEDSDNREVYREQKSGGQEFGEPLEDVQRLKDTPKSEWADKDDGFNEVAEANEVLAFVGRMSAGEQGDAMPDTDPALSKRDASLLEWGFDPSPGSSDFVGDRQ